MNHEEMPDFLKESVERVEQALPEEYKAQDRMRSLINREEVVDQYVVSEKYLNKYIGRPIRVVRDIEIYTNLSDQLINCKDAQQDGSELEFYRKLKPGTLTERGIFYSDGVETVKRYNQLKYTSFVATINDAFVGRYLLPIKFPDGDVFSYIGYDPNNEFNKYNVPKISTDRRQNWVRQGNLLGNMDSLERYKGVKEVFIAEGLFDAYQLENAFHRPALALLGSKIYRNKQALLQYIKNKYKVRYIFVPDFDASGLDHWLINSKLWDGVFNFNKGRRRNEVYQDVDAFLRENQEVTIEVLKLLM